MWEWVLAWFNRYQHDEDWPVYVLGFLILAVMVVLLVIVAVGLSLDALGIMPL